MRRVFLMGLAFIAAGCEGPLTCVSVPAAAVTVLVKDSASGVPAASGARLVVRDGSYVDSTSYPAGHPEIDAIALGAGWNRPGIYEITVRKAGYWDWVRSGVKVTEGRCNVDTARLTARLQWLITAASRS